MFNVFSLNVVNEAINAINVAQATEEATAKTIKQATEEATATAAEAVKKAVAQIATAKQAQEAAKEAARAFCRYDSDLQDLKKLQETVGQKGARLQTACNAKEKDLTEARAAEARAAEAVKKAATEEDKKRLASIAEEAAKKTAGAEARYNTVAEQYRCAGAEATELHSKITEISVILDLLKVEEATAKLRCDYLTEREFKGRINAGKAKEEHSPAPMQTVDVAQLQTLAEAVAKKAKEANGLPNYRGIVFASYAITEDKHGNKAVEFKKSTFVRCNLKKITAEAIFRVALRATLSTDVAALRYNSTEQAQATKTKFVDEQTNIIHGANCAVYINANGRAAYSVAAKEEAEATATEEAQATAINGVGTVVLNGGTFAALTRLNSSCAKELFKTCYLYKTEDGKIVPVKGETGALQRRPSVITEEGDLNFSHPEIAELISNLIKVFHDKKEFNALIRRAYDNIAYYSLG